MKQKTFNEKLDGKVWKAIKAMCDGLEEQDKRSDFIVDMETYGKFSITFKICYGCAATATIQRLCKHNFNADEIEGRWTRGETLDIDIEDLAIFEEAINAARSGCLFSIFQYMDREDAFTGMFEAELSTLQTGNWRERLPEYKKLWKQLKKLDI